MLRESVVGCTAVISCITLSLLLIMVTLGIVLHAPLSYTISWTFAPPQDIPDPHEYRSEIVSYISGTGHMPFALTQAEQAHIEDIRLLHKRGIILVTVLILILIITSPLLLTSTKATLYTLRAAALGPAVLALTAVLLFRYAFTYLHSLFFVQGSWIFSPISSTLVRAFTERFFMIMGVQMLVMFVLIGAGFWKVSLLLQNRKL